MRPLGLPIAGNEVPSPRPTPKRRHSESEWRPAFSRVPFLGTRRHAAKNLSGVLKLPFLSHPDVSHSETQLRSLCELNVALRPSAQYPHLHALARKESRRIAARSASPFAPRSRWGKIVADMQSPADTDWLVAQAKTLGFDLCGVTAAADLADAARLDEWLARGYAGEMRYLHDARRADPARVLPDAKSVIVCALNYNAPHPYSTEAAAENAASREPRGWISRYAWGDDYHEVLGEKLDQLVAALRERFGSEFAARAYVDTGPIVERAAAAHAGLGWLAKNTCLINRDLGSWLFLCVVVTSLDLVPSLDLTESTGGALSTDGAPSTNSTPSPGAARIPPPDLCGNCRLCLDACPTGALVEPYVLDARRCISYLTIELRGSIPEEFRSDMGWQVFGCDICQDVCPWNRSASRTYLPPLQPRENLVAPELLWLLSLSEEDFRRTFRASAVRRTKWRGLLRNVCVAAANAPAACSDPHAPEAARLRERLAALAASADAIIAEHATWALAQLTTR
jgi:epoxyqueuosine reductase